MKDKQKCDDKPEVPNETEVCTSEQCVGASFGLYKNMNTSADPCEDFEQFACGRFQQGQLRNCARAWASLPALPAFIPRQLCN